MRKGVIIVLLLLLSQLSSFSQEYEFGEVSKSELEEKLFPSDSVADAAYLYRNRITYYRFNQLESRFDVVTEVKQRIKIYNKAGFDKATLVIPYYGSDNGKDEKVSALKAYTFNLIGNKIKRDKLPNRNVFKEKINDNWTQKKITMPSIKEGSVIDIKYIITSPFYYKINALEFQFDIPVKKLEYSVQIPEFYNFKVVSKGYYSIRPETYSANGSLVISSKERDEVHFLNTSFNKDKIEFKVNKSDFKATNIPALRDNEPFVGNVNTYRGGMNYELASTDFKNFQGESKTFSSSWTDVSKQIYKASSFGGELSKSSYYKEALQKITTTKATEVEKIAAIFQFVKGNVKWNGFNSIFSDKGVKKAFKEHVGNVADINLMLTSMLRSAGLNADPVLVSTRTNGVPIFPTIDGFNYVISTVKLSTGGIVLLDATEPYSEPNILPRRALNWNGRRITKSGNSSWIKLTSSKLASQENKITASISDDMIVHGISRTEFGNLSALTYRKRHNHLTEEAVITSLEEEDKIEIEGFRLANEKLIGKPVTRTIMFNSQDLLERISNKLYIEPLLFLSQHENPFKLEERKFPVDFTTPWSVKNIISIQIPEGYKVESFPESLGISLPENLGVFKFQVIPKEDKIITTCTLQFNNAIIAPQYYATLKDFYNQLVQKQSEKIVLIKI